MSTGRVFLVALWWPEESHSDEYPLGMYYLVPRAVDPDNMIYALHRYRHMCQQDV